MLDFRVIIGTGVKALFLPALLLLSFSGAYCDGFRTPGSVIASSGLLYFSISNDGFGYDLGPDCDDLRSFGFGIGYCPSADIFLGASASSLTNRDSIESGASRVDELEVLAAYSFALSGEPWLSVSVSAGLGGLYFGNLGSGFVQQSFHDSFHFADARTVPFNYDPASVYAIACLQSEARENLLGMFRLAASARLTHSLDYTADLSLGYLVVKRYLQIEYSAVYGFNRSGTFSGAARAVYDAEDGVRLASSVSAGPLVIERSVNLDSLVPAGSIGLGLNRAMPEQRNNPLRTDYSLGGVFGFISNVEILRVHPIGAFERFSVYSWIGKHEDFDTYRKMLRLHIQSIGFELSLFDPEDRTVANPYAYAGIGFVNERHVTNDRFRASILDLRILLMIHLGAGGRLKLSDLFPLGEFEYGIEFSWDLRFCYPAESLYSNAMSTARYGIYISEK